MNVSRTYDTERFAFGRAPEVDSAEIDVLVLGYEDRVEVVVYETLGYC